VPATPVLPPPDSPFAPAADTPWSASSGDTLDSMPLTSGVRMLRIMKAPPKAPPNPVLQAEGLAKKFGSRQVVQGVNLEVGEGEIVGLLGRNGAGKTTTFRMVVGMLRPDSGKVRFDFHDITRLPMYKRALRGLGYLAQEPSVFQRLTVEENLLAVLELQVPDRKRRTERLDALIHDLGLQTVRKSLASTLSGGERRRLEIARAMTLKPRVVLFDEPFAGIDPIAVTEIQDILRDLKAANVGVLLTDHNVRETLTITDRTYIMDEGKIWIHGSPREIVNHPEARQRYLGQGFRLDF
jgi:lipopolysaccharide export system ATP-binding protein